MSRTRLHALPLMLLAPILGLAEPLFKFEDSQLRNGLRVITLEDFSTPIVAVHVWYGVGSKDEDPHRQGFAHMFEHMMFRGTEHLGPEEHFSLIRATGGDCNAFTSFDHTAYINLVPANQLELALWLEAERMMFLRIDQEGFDTERKVVEEERRLGINEPYGTLFEQGLPVLFTQHPYRWSPIGNIPMLRAAKLSELQRFWDYWYVPENATLVIVGAVKHGDALALARKYFEWMPRGDTTGRPKFSEPSQMIEKSVNLEEPLGPVPLVAYVYRGVPENHPDAVPLRLLMMALGDGESSRLNVDLVKKRKLAAQTLAMAYLLHDEGVAGAGAAVNPFGSLDDVATALADHVRSLREGGLEERELAKAKNRLKRQVVTSALTVMSKAGEIGATTLSHGSPEWLNEQLARIQAVTIEDVLRVANTYLVPERCTVFRVTLNKKKGLPNEESAPIAPPESPEQIKREGAKSAVRRPEWFPSRPPRQPILDEVPPNPTEEYTLPNGLRIVVVPNHELPFVTVTLGLKYGAWAEDPAAPGVASMTLAMLTKGTKKRNAVEMAELVEFNALTLSGSATLDESQVTATALADKLPLAVELMAEVVLTPTFPEDELAILKEQRSLDLSVQEQDPFYLANRELRQRVFGEHPYARSATGERADVPRIDRKRLQQYWKKYARPDQAVLYFAGDVDRQTAIKLAEQHFVKWKARGKAPQPALPAIPRPSGMHIYLVDKPGSVQSQIRVAQPSITRTSPDYHAARVFSQVYGGAFDSRLNKTLRVERGLTYGAGGGFRPFRFSGLFVSETFTKTESTAETVQALLDVINGMRSNPATDQELELARSYLAGSFPADLETPQDVVDFQWMIEYFALPKDYLAQAVRAYRSAKKDDIRHVATNVIDPASLTIVVVGEAAAVKESLERIAPVTVVSPAEATAKKTAKEEAA